MESKETKSDINMKDRSISDDSISSSSSNSSDVGIFTRVWTFIKTIIFGITVEPVVLLLCVGTGLYMIVASELYIDKVGDFW